MLDIAELFDFQPVYYSATVVFCPVFYALHSSVLEIQEIRGLHLFYVAWSSVRSTVRM